MSNLSYRQQLDTALSTQLTLTPQLQQAIRILNMGNQELAQTINEMLEQNFLLEAPDLIREDSDWSHELKQDDAKTEELGQENDFDAEELPNELHTEMDSDSDWEEVYSDWQEVGNPSADDDLEYQFSAPPSLTQYLLEQVQLMTLAPNQYWHCQIIIDALSADGYFREDLEELAKAHHCSRDDLDKALKLVQQLQPAGIGAHNLEECLSLQIEQLPQHTPYLDALKKIMQRYFVYLGKDHALICKRLALSQETFAHALALLRSLNPEPGHAYQTIPSQHIRPEIVVREKNGISYVETSDSLTPTVQLNQSYLALIKHSKGAEKELLTAQLQQAKFFLHALDKRAETVKRVATVIVAMQQEFFQLGEIAMQPLTRQQVGKLLNLHESTIARAVNGKYLQCRRGIYELRYFFSQQLENVDGEDSSTTAIRAAIAKLIEEENPKKPLSDQAICDKLNESGHLLARRTVAKYREQLGISSSSERRRQAQ